MRLFQCSAPSLDPTFHQWGSTHGSLDARPQGLNAVHISIFGNDQPPRDTIMNHHSSPPWSIHQVCPRKAPVRPAISSVSSADVSSYVPRRNTHPPGETHNFAWCWEGSCWLKISWNGQLTKNILRLLMICLKWRINNTTSLMVINGYESMVINHQRNINLFSPFWTTNLFITGGCSCATHSESPVRRCGRLRTQRWWVQGSTEPAISNPHVLLVVPPS